MHLFKKNIQSYTKSHATDNHFYNPTTKEHYVIELKSSDALDNKKAKSEKIELLKKRISGHWLNNKDFFYNNM